MSRARLWAVVPAAGIGARMGGERPKQYLLLAGEAVLCHSVGALLRDPRIEAVVVPVREDDRHAAQLPLFSDARVQRVAGGEQRCDSVRAGLRWLERVAAPEDWVLVHDAARPCLQAEDLNRLVAEVLASGEGGLLAQPVVDTLKRSDGTGHVEVTVDRRRYWRAQTPQMFRLGALSEALAAASAAGVEVTDEASAMEWAGHPVRLVSGDASNLKITLPGDLELAAWHLRQAGLVNGEST